MKTAEHKNVRAASCEDGLTPAVAETLRLYTAWLAVLLRHQDSDEIRIPTDELKAALTGFACQVGREDDAYVIRLRETGAAPDDGRMEKEGDAT